MSCRRMRGCGAEATAFRGDLLLLAEGDRLSADARLIAGAVEVDMSPLTGESQPVRRTSERSRRAAAPLEAEDLVFAGTLCTGGDAQAVVYGTGMHTQLGRIAALSQSVVDETSPLQRQVNRAAQLIALVAVVLGVAFFVIAHLVAGLSLAQAGTFAIGLPVANVPEGLLPTITLAVGVRRMAKRHALVKKLTAASARSTATKRRRRAPRSSTTPPRAYGCWASPAGRRPMCRWSAVGIATRPSRGCASSG